MLSQVAGVCSMTFFTLKMEAARVPPKRFFLEGQTLPCVTS